MGTSLAVSVTSKFRDLPSDTILWWVESSVHRRMCNYAVTGILLKYLILQIPILICKTDRILRVPMVSATIYPS
jgi:hypothetical protein